jgi:ABC-type transport system involved in multi-copper enzyme maturation permease subunit
MPETLCPYFWKLVFAWTVTVILSPILLPTWIVRKVTNDFDENVPIGPYALMGLLIYGAIFAVIGIGVFISSYWITYYQQTLGYSFYVTGEAITIIGSIGSITWGILELKSRIRDRRTKRTIWDDNIGDYVPNPHYEEPKPSLLVEFIKAKYNKYCPKIDWEN